MRFWRVVNPLARLGAGVLPFWVLLETTGRRTGRRRTTPLATGPRDRDGMWLLAVHGHRTAWVRNVETDPRIRMRHRAAWRAGRATVVPYDAAVAARFNAYARLGPRVFGIDPVLVRVEFDSGR